MTHANTNWRDELAAIGSISKATGVNVETIRYYERIGLLARPSRTPSRHRRFGNEHRQRLFFIRRARELGFSILEIKALLGLPGQNRTCAEIKSLTELHRASVQAKIRGLKRLERTLSDLAKKCGDGQLSHCPILDSLGTGDFFFQSAEKPIVLKP
jgi:MerR family mercuric resistance operon transcriptional regulator